MNVNVDEAISVERDILKRSYFAAGATLIVTSVLALALAMHHPVVHGTASSFPEFQSKFAAIQASSAWVHGLLIIMLGMFTNGQCWLRKAYGANRFLALVGVGAYGSGALFAALAAATSGFILPRIVTDIDLADPLQVATGQQIIGMVNEARDVFHHFSVVAITIGILLLAVVLFGARRQVGMALSCIALVVGTLACVALVTHHMPPTVHGVIAFAIFLALWNVVVAIALIRKSIPSEGTY